MTVPVIKHFPETGKCSGGDLIRIEGTGFASSVSVLFGDREAEVQAVYEDGGVCVAVVRTPAHEPGTVNVTLINLDAHGESVPGEQVTLPGAFSFERARLIRESNLTRLVRTLLRQLKSQLIKDAGLTVSVDYRDMTVDGIEVTALSTLPSIVLSGPRVSENRFYSLNEAGTVFVPPPIGPEFLRNRPPFTVDLSFSLTVASDRTVELLNLLAAVATFLNRNRWVKVPRNSGDFEVDTVLWEMDPEGEFRTHLDEGDDVRVFTCGFVVRGFDLDEGWPLDIGRGVELIDLETARLGDEE